MSFHSFSAFISMGGNGAFVWGAYSVALVIIVFNYVHPMMLKRRNLARVRRQLAREQARKQKQESRELVQ